VFLTLKAIHAKVKVHLNLKHIRRERDRVNANSWEFIKKIVKWYYVKRESAREREKERKR